jgi:hypothetical protein
MIGDMPLEEDLSARKPLSLLAWVEERLANCERLAATKKGCDKFGWLEDAAYLTEILRILRERLGAAEEVESNK